MRQVARAIAFVALTLIGVLALASVSRPASKDYISYWSAGKLLLRHEDPYSATLVLSTEKTLVNASSQYNPDIASNESESVSPAIESGQETDQTTRPAATNVRHFPANDRLEILPPEEPLKLAEPNEIQFRVHGRISGPIESSQIQYFPQDPTVPDRVFGSDKWEPVLYHSDGSPYVEIVPMRLGKVELTLGVAFVDGGVAIKKTTIDVGPTQKSPESIIVGPNSQQNVLSLPLSLTGFTSHSILNVYAKYDDLERLVTIDPAFANYKIINWDGRSSPIELDSQTGIVTAVHLGQALVETIYGGRRNLTCVDVEKTGINRIRSCEALLSGEKLGTQE